jgi:hypothetical protein
MGTSVTQIDQTCRHLVAEGVDYVHAIVGAAFTTSAGRTTELPLCDELPCVADEDLDDVPLGRREPDLAVRARDFFRREVDTEVRGLDERLFLGRCRPALTPPYHQARDAG